MEDKRIKKTKRYLKETMIKLLDSETFENISVTELCDCADISRITFYTHYKDKYDLIEDIFTDMVEIGTEEYRRRESELNKDDDLVKGFLNVLDSIFYMYYGNYEFFKHVQPSENPYLAFTFYNRVLKTVEHHTNKEGGRHLQKYSTSQITGLICYGLLGFISESLSDGKSNESIVSDASKLLRELLESNVLFERLH